MVEWKMEDPIFTPSTWLPLPSAEIRAWARSEHEADVHNRQLLAKDRSVNGWATITDIAASTPEAKGYAWKVYNK